MRPRGNVPAKALRWSINRASNEFKLAANTLQKILNQGGAEPDATGCYSTQQICQCLYGDLRAEKLRKERELVRKYQLGNEFVEASVLDRAELERGLAMVADAMVSRIMSSELSRPAKEDLLKDLSSVPLILEGVARDQSRLARNGKRNGDGDGNED